MLLAVAKLDHVASFFRAIKAFKLDPNAKEFNPVAFMPATATATTTVARTAASPVSVTG